jgi:hypothetical protein
MKTETAQATNIRPNKELLQVFLDNQGLFFDGLCNWISALKCKGIITEDEYDFIYDMIEKYPDYFGFQYMWPSGQIQPRIDWLKEKLTKQKEDEEEGITQRD